MQNYHNLRKLARKYRKILHKTRNLCKNVPPYHSLPPFIRQNIWPYQIISVPLHPKTIHRGVEQLVARQAHNLEVACSSPAPATKAWFPQAFFVGSPLHMLPVAVLRTKGEAAEPITWTSQAAWPITSTSEAAEPSVSPAPTMTKGGGSAMRGQTGISQGDGKYFARRWQVLRKEMARRWQAQASCSGLPELA